jgi:hypothetical protein
VEAVPMEISTVRDIVISILGCLYIILTIGIIAGLIVIFLKLRKLLISINSTIISIHKVLAHIRGLMKGLNESAGIFKKGGD